MLKEKLFVISIVLVYVGIITSILIPDRPVELVQEAGITTVTFWHAGAGKERVSAIKELISKFEAENPSIKVKLKIIPWDQKPHDKVQIAIASRTEPDIASVGSPFDKVIADFGTVEPLNKRIDAEVIDDFFYVTRYAGGVASLPWFMDVRALIYRKDYLRKKKVPEPVKSWTWEEFLHYAQLLTEDVNHDGIIDIYGYTATLRYAYQFLVFVWQNGGQLYSEDGKRAIIASEEAREAIQFFIDLITKYKVSPRFTTENMFIIRKMFAEGKIAMFMDCSDAACALAKEPELVGKIGVGQIPHRKVEAAFSGADVLVIFRRAKHKKEALQFLKFLIREDNLLDYAKKTGFSPPRKTVADNPYFTDDPMRKAFVEQAKVGRFWDMPSFTPTPKQILTRYIQMALEGKLTVEEALKQAQQQMNEDIGSLY